MMVCPHASPNRQFSAACLEHKSFLVGVELEIALQPSHSEPDSLYRIRLLGSRLLSSIELLGITPVVPHLTQFRPFIFRFSRPLTVFGLFQSVHPGLRHFWGYFQSKTSYYHPPSPYVSISVRVTPGISFLGHLSPRGLRFTSNLSKCGQLTGGYFVP